MKRETNNFVIFYSDSEDFWNGIEIEVEIHSVSANTMKRLEQFCDVKDRISLLLRFILHIYIQHNSIHCLLTCKCS